MIRRGGVPSGAAQVIAMGLALPKSTGVELFFMGNPEFSTNCKATVYGGDSACPPETAPSLCDCVVLPCLSLSLQEIATAAGVEASHTVAPKER